AGLGILLASWLLRTLSSLAALDSIRPIGMDYRVDGGVAAFAVALALVIALVLALVPLRIIRTMDFQCVLRESTTGGVGRRHGRVRRTGVSSPLPPAVTPAVVIAVSPAYFATAGVRVEAGREFDDNDREATMPVAIVNQWAARRWWPNAAAVGQSFRIDSAAGAGVTVTVVGVVRDNKAAQPNVLL